MQLHLIFGSCY